VVDQRRQRRNLPSPFFFIVGAGVSHPPIPLASNIQEDCRKEAEKYGETAPPKSNAAIDSYSHWFTKAYPSAEDRQEYLRGLMEKQTISKANLRLAHLLLDGTVARTVFTPNFDEMLTKALTLFGQRPLVCDHPLTVGRMRIESRDIQIIHVHGSYWFYDCCNLTDELSDRSKDASMSVMLDQSLREHSPLVVGYSGWDGDILMGALRRRLESRGLGTPLYWFCYRKESVANLPDWLAKHPDVRLVIPDDPAAAVAVPTAPSADVSVQTATVPTGVAKAGESASEARDAGLRAERVFDALVRRFNLPAPPLTKNPLSFYANQLKDFLGTRDDEPDTYYSFHTVIDRVEKASYSEADKAPEKFQGFRDAMSKANYRDAIVLAGQVNLDTLSTDELKEVVSVLMDASLGLNDNSAQEILGYDLIVKAAHLLERSGAADLRVQELVSKALYNKAVTLNSLSRGADAIVVYDDLLRRFGTAVEPVLREQVAMALYNKGCGLGVLKKFQEEIDCYNDLLERFADSDQATLRQQVAKALFNKAFSLGMLDQSREAISVYDELLRRFGDAEEPALRVQVARALFNKAYRLGMLNEGADAIKVYDELFVRFGEAQDAGIREQVAKGMLNKGVTLGELGQIDEEVLVYDDLLLRFRDAPEPALREQVAKALVNKGFRLGGMNKFTEEIALYEDLVARFGDSQESALRVQVAKALFNKAFRLGVMGNSTDAIAVYDDLLRRFVDAPEQLLREQVARAIFNKAVMLADLDKSDEELLVYEELLQRFGDSQEPALRVQVAKTLFNKGYTFESTDRKPQAVTVYEELLAKFDGSTETELQQQVGKAKAGLERIKTGVTAPA
jgi:tetratricopeptide (TPR) repeat protein